MLLLAVMSSLVLPSSAQSLFHRADSILAARYYCLGNIDTAYITRPQTKWTVTARLNVSGAKIGAEGFENSRHFKSEMEANRKATLSLGAELHPAPLRRQFPPGSIRDGTACHPRLGTGDAVEDDEHRAWGRLWLQLRAR